MKEQEFKQYQRSQIAELRLVTESDIKDFESDKVIYSIRDTEFKVSISDVDLKNGSPKIGDMIAGNPQNHKRPMVSSRTIF